MLKYSKTTRTRADGCGCWMARWQKKEKRKSKEKAGIIYNKGIRLIGARASWLGNNRKNALITLSNDT